MGRETDTTREIETDPDSVTYTTEEIETGIVTSTEKESTKKRGEKLFNDVTDLNKQISKNSDTGELFRGSDGPDRHKDRGQYIDEDRIVGIETIETTRETEIQRMKYGDRNTTLISVPETSTEIETGTVTATETGSTH